MNAVGLDQVGSQAAEVKKSNGTSMGKDDFLKLLVTQLQKQDPLSPMDSTAFTAQLAQFSSLEELQNINETLGGVGNSQQVLTNSQAVDFIGKKIQALGDKLELSQDGPIPVEFNLAQDAAGVYVKIYNNYGEFVQDIEAGPMGAGQQRLEWNGLDHLDQQAPAGTYRYEVLAVDAEGNTVSAKTFTTGAVSGVFYKQGLAYLLTADQEIPLGDVVQVYE
jgi:flagellar basal-body rod modification protein FlgD